PALLSHRIMRGADGSYAWEIAFDGLQLPDGDQAPSEDLCDVMQEQVREAIADLGEVRSAAAYVDLSCPAPGPGCARPPIDATGGISFAEGDLPGWEDYAADSGTSEAGRELSGDVVAAIKQAHARVPVEPGLKPYGSGHMYAGVGDKAHAAYLS